MADWVFVCATSQLLPGEMTTAWDGDTAIALCAPAYEPVAKFPVKVDDTGIWTRDDRD